MMWPSTRVAKLPADDFFDSIGQTRAFCDLGWFARPNLAATNEVRGAAPRVMRQRFDASQRVDASDRRIGGQRSICDSAQCRAAGAAP
jgi:hypothetical protein